MKLKESLGIIFIIGIVAAVYFYNPTHRFELEQKFASRDCQVTNHITRKVYDSDVVCEKYDTYFSEAKNVYYRKYSSELDRCLEQSILDYRRCDSVNDIMIHAIKSAKITAEVKCKTDYKEMNSKNKMLLAGETNCNQDTIIDFIVTTNYKNDSSRLITKGYLTIKDGKFKKIVNLGEEYDDGGCKVLFK